MSNWSPTLKVSQRVHEPLYGPDLKRNTERLADHRARMIREGRRPLDPDEEQRLFPDEASHGQQIPGERKRPDNLASGAGGSPQGAQGRGEGTSGAGMQGEAPAGSGMPEEGSRDSLAESLLEQACGHYPTALQYACDLLETVTCSASAGFARLPPAVKPREPKPAPKTAL